MILVIDNYDSFVHNLARYVVQLSSEEVVVVRNDQLDRSIDADAVIISPGPGGPDQAGMCLDFVKQNLQRMPMLGVCLGHQIIVQALGGAIEPSEQPRHGKTSPVTHFGGPLFTNVPSPFDAGRYHSLVARSDQIPDCLDIAATTDDRVVMAVQHQTLPVFGLQFHPESVITQFGYQIVYNFLDLAGLAMQPYVAKDIFA